MVSLVSIIIPTYNRAHLIAATLDSIQAQSYTNWECLVIDDGSKDNTENIIEKYSEKDHRFRFLKRPNTKQKGANACRNFGLEQCKGELVNFFDSDDIMHPDKLTVQVKALKLHTESPYCICQTKWVDKKTNKFLGLRAKTIISDQPFEDYILFKIFWSILAPLWKKEFLLNNALFFDETLHQSQEYDFHIKALAIDDNYAPIDSALATMYRHQNNISYNIYDSDLKIESNLRVKATIVSHHLTKLSPRGRLKFLEILTLQYKDLLKLKKNKLAFKLLPILFKAVRHTNVPFAKKTVFCTQLFLAYVSYKVTGRGYTIVKPLK